MSMYDKLRRDIRISKGYTDSDSWVPDWASGKKAMFTVEMDHEEITVTVLDNEGNWDDVELILYDDVIYIRQFDEQEGHMQMIAMSPQMFGELMLSMKHPEGSYLTKYK